HWMFIAFGVFILACGATHAMAIWTLWQPMYRLDGLVKAVTAIASVTTAICLIRLLPALLQIPSLRQLEVANEALERKIAEHKQAELAVHEGERQFRLLADAVPQI